MADLHSTLQDADLSAAQPPARRPRRSGRTAEPAAAMTLRDLADAAVRLLRNPRIAWPLSALACLLLGLWLGRAVFAPAPTAPTAPAHTTGEGSEPPLAAVPEALDWRSPALFDAGLPPYARFLKDVRIVIDPGHGGDAHREGFKRSRWGLREAEVNLRVAQYLRDFLLAADAQVTLTRETDVALADNDDADLAARAEIANRANADLFVSVHHNYAENPAANYSLIFFRGAPDESAASLAAARHVLTGLNDALRLAQHVDCAIRSDTAVYDSGFRLLRQARVPAILIESSFYSNEEEERRLRDPEYNRTEAHGIFLGLARWAQAGLPSIALREPPPPPRPRGARQRRNPPPKSADEQPCVVELRDGVSDRGSGGPKMDTIRWDTLRVLVNDSPVEATIDRAARTLTLPWTRQELRGATLRISFENLNGQPVAKPYLQVP